MMVSMRLNTCVETIYGNTSWNNSRSVVVDDAHNIMLVIVCTENMEWIHEQACTENMEWIHEHSCSEYMQAMAKV